MVVRVEVKPELLQWAVRRAGWDEETALDKFPRLVEWLSGDTLPTLRQLEEFARKSHVPFGQLFLPEPPVESIPIPDLRTLKDEQLKQPSAELLDTIYLCQRRQDWYRDFAVSHGFDEVSFVGQSTTHQNPADAADGIRSALALDTSTRVIVSDRNTTFRNLIDRIEGLGVLVMVNGVVGDNTSRPLDPEEFRGFALADPIAPLIFVNGADTRSAQIFTLIHELAHLCLGSSALSDARFTADGPDGSSHQSEERWCNQVAAEVLVPLEDIRADFTGSLDESTLQKLSNRYQVSTLVILTRIYEANLVSWENYRTAYRAEHERIMSILAAKPPSNGGNFYNTQVRRLGRLFASSVVSSTFEGSTPFRDAYRLLGTRSHKTFTKLADTLEVA
ncbi:ImmA/IrrE family metallo-endopeptidase [Corynebacterium sputi]|uniref:ImmA/IrrE family metallo-endopeptidase n=1 Tax=Corynebacterium sputi TaxID=489915 RepID=UPI00041BE051|nr:ImmA/IrrE family metallo-endopeptidase [Corynebacterium sputi]